MARIRLLEKSCHYLKNCTFLYNQFEIGFFGTMKYFSFRASLVQNQLYGLCELRTCKKMARIRLFKKKLSLFKEVAVFLYNQFKIGFLVLRNIAAFVHFFLVQNQLYGLCELRICKKWPEYVYLKKSCPYLKKLQFSL